MAAASSKTQFSEEHKEEEEEEEKKSIVKKKPEMDRQEIERAIAKAVELRALHAALMQGNNNNNSNSPANPTFSSPSFASHFSAQDYPVFTPSYEDDPVLGYQQNSIIRSQTVSESWDENIGEESGSTIPNMEITSQQHSKEKSSSRKGLVTSSCGFESHHVCPIVDDTKSLTGSCGNHITLLQSSPANSNNTNTNDFFYKSRRRNSLDDFSSISNSKPPINTAESEITNTTTNNTSNFVVPSQQPKSKGVMSWLFPRLKKKHKNEAASSPNRTESEEVSQVFKDLGVSTSIEALKKELIEANDNRDAALMQVSEMKSSLGELKQKLEYLESYCEELKKALKQAIHMKNSQVCEKLSNLPMKEKNVMPVSEEVMIEGFLQIVSEARLSVKQFCKTLITQIEETDHSLMQNLNQLLQPFKLSLNSKYSKAVLYHFEAFINQCLYQDFENCVFQKNGCPKFLDPQQDRQAKFSSFVGLRNLSWNEVLRKGTKYYSEEFSKFCDHKMSCIITTLNWTRAWPEELLQAFFVAAKCIWLLHLLAFSFNPALGILRVEENVSFNAHYMEDMCGDRQRSQGPSRVKMMVMPGFYVHDRVLRCKVLCRYKSVAS